MSELLLIASGRSLIPQLIAAAGEQASIRFLDFFATNIRNPHTRRAYARAAEEFLPRPARRSSTIAGATRSASKRSSG
jgi:hypothetical protein